MVDIFHYKLTRRPMDRGLNLKCKYFNYDDFFCMSTMLCCPSDTTFTQLFNAVVQLSTLSSLILSLDTSSLVEKY